MKEKKFLKTELDKITDKVLSFGNKKADTKKLNRKQKPDSIYKNRQHQ